MASAHASASMGQGLRSRVDARRAVARRAVPGWVWLAACLFLLPVGLCMLGLAAVAKPLFLGGAALLALKLVGREPACYVAFVLWLLVVTPGLRHFVDWYAGFSQTNVMMLAPYGAILLAAPTVVLYVLNGRRHSGPLVTMAVLVGFGLWVTMLGGSMQDAGLTAVRWLSPMVFGAYIWAQAAALPEIRATVLSSLRIALPAVAAYGVVQFVSVPPWDAYYMETAPISSIGRSLPFEVRVFSTMNHPGTLAALLSAGILLLLPRIRGPEFVGILLASCTLFLTTQRAAIGALCLSLLVIVVASRSRAVRRGFLKLAIISAAAVLVASAVPEMGQKLTSTFASIARLGEDDSAQARLMQYGQLAIQVEGSPFGAGLAWATNRVQRERGAELALDSGVIDILVSFGIAGGLLFLGMLAVLLARGWMIATMADDAQARAELGVVIYGLALLPFSSQHAGEPGVFLYLGLGLLLARACGAPAATAEGPEAIRRPAAVTRSGHAAAHARKSPPRGMVRR
jgi:hypothetical protein